MKPKRNSAADLYAPKGMDACQTPTAALLPLLRHIHLSYEAVIWEPAEGEGILSGELRQRGYLVVGTDILTGQNFFEFAPPRWDCLITNPPYSIKYPWIKRCYLLGKPFALLMPIETLGAATAQDYFKRYGLELIVLNRRLNFKMPNVGWDGSRAQFPVAWYTWGFQIGNSITYATLEAP